MDLVKVERYAEGITTQKKRIEALKLRLRMVEKLRKITLTGVVRTEYESTWFGGRKEREFTDSFSVHEESSVNKLVQTILKEELQEEITKAEQDLEKFIKAGVPNE